MLKQLGGIEMVHVPYRGAAPALTDLLAGQVNLYFSPLASALDHIQAGRLRAIAVTSEKRSAIFPSAPTIAEFVPGYEASQLYGVGAPKDTPREIIELLNKEINAALASQRVDSRLAQLGVVPLPGPPATFRKIFEDETEKWAKVVKASGAKAD
jgi:tripartite-type tricarboxylate transporter receptor subunit TctC